MPNIARVLIFCRHGTCQNFRHAPCFFAMKRFIRELSTRRPASAHVNRAPLAPSPSDLLRRLTEFHLSDDGRKNKSEAEERSRSVLRWMRESDKCKDEQSLERMVDQYVVKQLPLAYILGMLRTLPVFLAYRCKRAKT